MKKIILLNLVWLSFTFAYSNAKFEPPDGRVIHGLGHYIPVIYTNFENWQYVYEYQNGVNNIPMVYSAYVALDPFLNSIDSTDFIDIVYNHGYPYVMLIGLGLHDSTYLTSYNINIPTQRILSGVLDYRIIDIAQRIKAINAPVYFRPGFEFGEGNSGMHSDPNFTHNDFINIWLHIYTIFEQENVNNVSWIWNTVNPHLFNYMDWYPGDDFVDWWGVNYFTVNQINSSIGFLNEALIHNKPVMICESCPIHNGGTTNPDNWQNWFIPYFNQIKNFPQIKAFVYTSDPHDRGPFGFWPDSRITSNEVIRVNYQNELHDSIYIHMSEYLNNPHIINDTIAPSPIRNFTANSGDRQIILNWKNPPEPDFLHVSILRKTQSYPQNINDGEKIYTGTDTFYCDLNLENDTTYYYAAYTFDIVQNFSMPVFTYGTPRFIIGFNHFESNLKKDKIFFRNSPNPFNISTKFKVVIVQDGFFDLSIYNVAGQKVATIFRGFLGAGEKYLVWDASDFSSGIYFAVLSMEEHKSDQLNKIMVNDTQFLKLLLIK